MRTRRCRSTRRGGRGPRRAWTRRNRALSFSGEENASSLFFPSVFRGRAKKGEQRRVKGFFFILHSTTALVFDDGILVPPSHFPLVYAFPLVFFIHSRCLHARPLPPGPPSPRTRPSATSLASPRGTRSASSKWSKESSRKLARKVREN